MSWYSSYVIKISVSQTLVPIRTPAGLVKNNTGPTPHVGYGTRISISNKCGGHILSSIDSKTEN